MNMWTKILLLFALSLAIEIVFAGIYYYQATGPLAEPIAQHTETLESGVIPQASEIDIENDPWVRVAHFESSLGQAQLVIDMLVSIGIALVLIFGGVSATLAKKARELSPHVYLSRALYLIFLTAIVILIDLPLAASGYIIGLLRGTSLLTTENVIFGIFYDLVLAVIFTLAVYVPFYFIMDRYKKWWWAIGAFFVSLFAMFTAFIGPVVIDPLYYELTPLVDSNMRVALELGDVIQAADIPIERVYVSDASVTTFESNAMVVGLGATKRIVLDDTLLTFYEPREIRAIVAHEIGHYVLGHLWYDIAPTIVLTFVTFYFLSHILRWIIRAYGTRIGARGINDIVLFPLLGTILMFLPVIMAPATSYVSREFERQADAYALQQTKNPQASIDGLKKLAYQSFVDVDPPRWLQVLFGTHPTLTERIEFFERSVP